MMYNYTVELMNADNRTVKRFLKGLGNSEKRTHCYLFRNIVRYNLCFKRCFTH